MPPLVDGRGGSHLEARNFPDLRREHFGWPTTVLAPFRRGCMPLDGIQPVALDPGGSPTRLEKMPPAVIRSDVRIGNAELAYPIAQVPTSTGCQRPLILAAATGLRVIE